MQREERIEAYKSAANAKKERHAKRTKQHAEKIQRNVQRSNRLQFLVQHAHEGTTRETSSE
jgi:hypothetical protein